MSKKVPRFFRRVPCWYNIVVAFVLFAVVVSVPLTARSQGSPESRERFLGELSKSLLGSDGVFREINQGNGWRGVLLAQPGSSISPLTEAYTGLPGELAQSLANSAVFDRPVEIKDGYAIFLPSGMDDVWRSILERTRPKNPLPLDKMATADVMKWLFAPRYSGRKIIGYTREPSKFVKRYREFESLYTQLLRGRANDMWRLDPRLERYSSFEHAQRVILDEWFKSGYKAEVDSATWSFGISGTSTDWSDWAAAKHAFDTFRRPIDLYNKVPDTYLIPPPASWSSVSTWIRTKSQLDGDKGELRYQLARVRIARPWFDIAALVDGRLELRHDDTIVSSGDAPGFSNGPSGILPGFVEELILSRAVIHHGSGDLEAKDHPLAIFSYPESVNLVGFIVRVLPRVNHGDSVEIQLGLEQ